MDCNKDDAVKAKAIAERKFNAKDMEGAKKFALKAQNLYPGLDGISQMLATLDVYVSAENKMYGEADWYGILDATPRADEDTIRKQYRKLALMLHPDKNKSIGAEGAFKLLSEAWSLLSDKNKRAAYDSRRSSRGYQQKNSKPPTAKNSSFPPGANGFYNMAKTATSSAGINKTTPSNVGIEKTAPSKAGINKTTPSNVGIDKTAPSNAGISKTVPCSNGSSASGSATKAKHNTFWTICHRCKMQYEYLRSYINHNLLCPNCHKPFFAIETPPPVSNGSRSSRPWNPDQVRKKSNPNAGYNTSNFEWTPFSGAAGASSVARAANVVQKTYEKVKRVREEAQAAKKKEKALKRKKYGFENTVGSSAEKKRRVSDDWLNSNQVGKKAAGFGMGLFPHGHSASEPIDTNNNRKINSTRELSPLELRNILVHKARTEILVKVPEWKSDGMVHNSAQRDKVVENSFKKDQCRPKDEVNSNSDSRTVDNEQQAGDKTLQSVTNKGILDLFSIPVPDPDFHDFDKDRTERAFRENQVWALYDNDDGMPRYYAIIHRVDSRDPFTVRISWLNSKTDTEVGPLNWVACGFTKTCGNFRLGRHETYSGLNCFSHQISCTKGSYGAIRIFPRRGEVWALYRNWSRDWNELTSDEVIFKYDIVEVLQDCDEQLGVVIIPLVKVAGFKAVFHQHLDSKQARRISMEEIFRFSHQVPSHLLSGNEAPNAPKGCHELDPAALPLDLMTVIEDVKESADEKPAPQPRAKIEEEKIEKILS